MNLSQLPKAGLSGPVESFALRRTRVKICGITNREDAEAAVELGADALGFNTFPGSKRYIDLRREVDWLSRLPPFVTRVAVMVNPTIEEAVAVADLPFIDLVQLHGAEDREFCRVLAERGLSFIKAIALKDESSLKDIEQFSAAAILVDTYSPKEFGGTGQLLDLDLAATFAASYPRLIVSGGLRPGNVSGIVRRIRPYAVDVASGVERDARRKDRQMLADFLEAVRSA